MRQTTSLLITLLLGLTLSACMHSPVSATDTSDLVSRFVRAFNAQDAGAMARLVTEDIQWLSIDGANVTVEVEGRDALVTAMTGYFQSCPSCRSSVPQRMATGSRVSTIEVAQWDSKSGPASQRAIAVYELEDGLIRRVYYFPSET